MDENVGIALGSVIAKRMLDERPQGWPSDARGDWMWESQIINNLLNEYQTPEAQSYLQNRLDELLKNRY